MKEKLTIAPILRVPNPQKQFVVITDASEEGLGSVLMQDEQVIAYASRKLKNYEVLWLWQDFIGNFPRISPK